MIGGTEHLFSYLANSENIMKYVSEFAGAILILLIVGGIAYRMKSNKSKK